MNTNNALNPLLSVFDESDRLLFTARLREVSRIIKLHPDGEARVVRELLEPGVSLTAFSTVHLNHRAPFYMDHDNLRIRLLARELVTFVWDDIGCEISQKPDDAAVNEGWLHTGTYPNGVRRYEDDRGHVSLEVEASDDYRAAHEFAQYCEEFLNNDVPTRR